MSSIIERATWGLLWREEPPMKYDWMTDEIRNLFGGSNE